MPKISLKGIRLTKKQKKIAITTACVLFVCLLLAQFLRKEEFKIQAGSPSEILDHFYNCIQKGDIDKAATFIDRTKIYHGRDIKLSQEEENRQATDLLYTYTNGVCINSYKITDETIKGDTAIVTIETDGVGPIHGEHYTLVKKDSVWKVVL